MYVTTKRMERIYKAAEKAAKQGQWEYKTKLYSKEITILAAKDCMDITIHGDCEKGLYDAKIEWKTAFNAELMTDEQKKYITAQIEELPEFRNLSQKLALISYRAIKTCTVK